MGFVMLQDELEGLGDIFHPMDAEEQGEKETASTPDPHQLGPNPCKAPGTPRGLSDRVIPSSFPAQLAASEPGPRVLTADRASYFVRLGDVAPRFRQRAFEHALSHLQHSQFQARATLAQLDDSFGLVRDPPPHTAFLSFCGFPVRLW